MCGVVGRVCEEVLQVLASMDHGIRLRNCRQPIETFNHSFGYELLAKLAEIAYYRVNMAEAVEVWNFHTAQNNLLNLRRGEVPDYRKVW